MAAEPQTAFDMLQVLRHQPNIDGVATDCHAFQYLVKLKNKEEATAWIRPRIPEHLLYLAPVMFYEYGLYDLLWDILEHPDAPEHPDASMHADYVWLLRAAGSLHEQGANDSHMEQLKQYYEGHASRAYDTIGRYLLGLGPIEAVLTLAESDPKKLCEVAYFVGLKAETEEHFEEAADWYLICLGTGLTSNRECAWAYDTLRSWKNSGRRLRDKDTVEVEAPPDEAETVF
ncbi:MAG: hypothetical protein HYZ00_12655 [Candidatus Hydrogenedentes bacterium]|nr:hypothetical protein [Candidatus Hydrogenedentota bacterium]